MPERVQNAVLHQLADRITDLVPDLGIKRGGVVEVARRARKIYRRDI